MHTTMNFLLSIIGFQIDLKIMIKIYIVEMKCLVYNFHPFSQLLISFISSKLCFSLINCLSL